MLPRLLIAAHRRWAAGGEQVQQGLLGDADGPADADCAELAACDRLVELVAPNPQDRCGLADLEHLGQPVQRSGGVLGYSGAGRQLRLGRRSVATAVRVSPFVYLGIRMHCCGRRWPACRAVGCGVGWTIARFRAQVWGVFAGGSSHRGTSWMLRGSGGAQSDITGKGDWG